MRRKSFHLFAVIYLVAVAICQTVAEDAESLNLDNDNEAESATSSGERLRMMPKPCEECRKRRTQTQSSTTPTTVDQSKFIGTCGYSNPGAHTLLPRFGEGLEDNKNDSIHADFGEFPWMVAVLKRRSDSEAWIQDNYLGGGSLIHPTVVVTTAHLVRDRKIKRHLEANQIKIRAGEWDVTDTDELYDHQDRNVAKIVIHEHYFRDSMYNDIALLILEAAVVLEEAPHIGIGCLAPQLPPPGTVCFGTGWGIKDLSNKKVFSPKLKKIKLPLLRKEKCEKYMRKTYVGDIFRLHQSLVCAGGEEGIANCKGDGGSPLVCSINSGGSRFAIYGLYAYNVACGVKEVPGVYVNVPNFYKWVEKQLASEGLDAGSYTFM